MSCNYFKNLNKYVDHELPNEEMAIMEKHILSCDFCKSELKTISLLRRAFGKGKVDSKAEFFWQKLKVRIDQEMYDRFQQESFTFDFSNWTKRLIPLPVIVAATIILMVNIIPVNINLVDEYIFGTSLRNASNLVINGSNKSVVEELLY